MIPDIPRRYLHTTYLPLHWKYCLPEFFPGLPLPHLATYQDCQPCCFSTLDTTPSYKLFPPHSDFPFSIPRKPRHTIWPQLPELLVLPFPLRLPTVPAF